MADTKISDLTAVVTPALADTFPVVQGGVTKKETLTQVRTVMVPIVLTADVSGTLPVANGGTGITSLGAGVATWWGTPSSANLLAAMTDETGTGALVFANTPTLVTPVIGAATGTSLAASSFVSVGASPASAGAFRMANGAYLYSRDSAGTGDIRVIGVGGSSNVIRVGGGASGFDLDLCGDSTSIWNSDRSLPRVTADSSAFHVYTVPLWIRSQSGASYSYKFATSNLAAHRDVTLPLLTGNDTFVFEAHTQTLTNKTASGPSFAASSFLSVGATPATTGAVRLANGSIIKARDVGNTNDRVICDVTSSNEIFIGTDSGFTATQWGTMRIAAGSPIIIGTTVYQNLHVDSAALKTLYPIIGYSGDNSPYSVHGGVAHTFAADTNYTVTAAQFALDRLRFNTGSWTTGRTVTLPHPASVAVGYYKTIFNNTTQTITVSTGTGTTKTLATTLAQRFWFDSDGVSFAGATYTP